MKSGRTLSELAAELERQAATKKDFIADTRKLSMVARAGDKDDIQGNVTLEGVNGGMRLRSIAHEQMADTLQIPKKYYDRLLAEQPDLLATNVNRWLQVQPAKKLIRTLDNEVRAILTDGYRPLDNMDLAEAVLPKLFELQAQVVSCQVTDSRLYLKVVTDKIKGDVKVGDTIQAGGVISNSEVGQGKIRIDRMDHRLICLNGMIRESVIAKVHVGRGSRRNEELEDAREYFRTETRQADDRAFFMKVSDSVAALFSQEHFDKHLDQYRAVSDRKIEADPIKVVEVTAKRFGLNDGEKSSVLQHLIRGGDLSAWGLANAVTRAAQDVESYDRSTDMEAMGGDIVELSQSEWKTLAV